MANIQELKKKIEIVILESYSKSKEKNFQDFNYVFPKSKSVIAFLKEKIKIFHNLDEYSATFLSIHTRAKITLREFQEQNFNGAYLELLRLIFTLPEDLNSSKLKSIKVYDKEVNGSTSSPQGLQIKSESEFTAEAYKAKKRLARTKIIGENITGKKITKQKQEQEILIEELYDIDFEDEEFSQEENDLSDINL